MKQTKTINMGEKLIGDSQPPFVIAEMSGNHNQSFERAIQLIDAAVDAKVDAIKLQTYTADTLTINCNNEYFQVKVNDAWKGKTLYQLYQEAYTPWEWQEKLIKYGQSKRVLMFSTPFDIGAVDFLENLGVQLYKVASFEVGHIPLLKRIGQTKKPVIISRGLATLEELELAIKTLKNAGTSEIAILHCISSYPATAEQMNLKTIPDLKKKFGTIVGISDHTLGLTVPITAVALGASIVEKHFTLSRSENGPDASFSLEPLELKEMVKVVREAYLSLGKPTYVPRNKEKENLVFKRSIFVIKYIKKGDLFNTENIRIIRPGYGLTPKYYEEIIGKKAAKDLDRGTPLSWEAVQEIIQK